MSVPIKGIEMPTRVVDSFRVEETYSWRNDVMGITRRIVYETDEARLSNIANHFEVDLSEIRAFLEMKQQQQRKPITNVVERKKGEWYDRGSLSCRCSNCGCKANKEYSFCPNCGADMRGREDERTN